jgi:hypothetical protein
MNGTSTSYAAVLAIVLDVRSVAEGIGALHAMFR